MSDPDKNGSIFQSITKKELQNRLYDQGFTHYTMPSVNRHQNVQQQTKPLVVRLYSLNNNLIKPVKQPQTSILVNKNYNEAKHDAQFQEIYQTQMKHGYTTKAKPFQEEQLKDQQNHTLKKLNLSSNPQDQGQSKQINQKELEQSKMVLDKLREKYLEQTKFYRNNKIINQLDHITKENYKDALIRHSNLKLKDKSSSCQGRKFQQELDRYIDLILKKSPNVDDFVYLIQNPESDDPYDLVLRNYFQIEKPRKQKKKNQLAPLGQNQILTDQKTDYYTISCNGLVRFIDGKPTEFISLNDWVKERETYDKIRNLGFFANFLKWKTVKLWRKSYKSFKKKVAIKSLEEKLFINYPVLKDAIIQTKFVLYKMSQLIFMDLNFNKENNAEVMQINDFVKVQEIKSERTQKMIGDCAKDCHSIYMKSLETQLATLRDKVADQNENDNMIKKNKNEQFVQINENPYEALNFPESMSYDKRSVLRKECYRFIKFAYFIDFLATDTLIKVYINTLYLFMDEITEISNLDEAIVLREFEKQKPIGSKDALFKIKLYSELNYENMEGLEIEEKQIQDFKVPKIQDDELKPGDFDKYNLLSHPFRIEYGAEDEYNVQKKKQLEYGDNQVFKEQKVVNIQKVCLFLRPNIATFQDNLDKIFLKGQLCLKNFFSLAKHQEMKKYYDVLEEWEEHDDPKENSQEETELKPMECIDQDFKIQLEQKIKELFIKEFEKTESFMLEFQKYLQIDWEYSNINFDILTSQNLAKPGSTFNCIFNLLNFHKQIFEFQIPFQSDLGLFRLESQELKTQLMEKPLKIQEKIQVKMIKQLQERFQQGKEWISTQLNNLKQQSDTIDSFINQIHYAAEIDMKFEFYKDLIKTSKEILDTIKKFQVEIPKEVMLLYTECKALEQSLITQKTSVDDNINKNKEFFINQINDENIPNLKKQCHDLQETLQDEKYVKVEDEMVQVELEAFMTQVNLFKEQSTQFNMYKQVLGQEQMRFNLIKELENEIQVKILLNQSHHQWYKITEQWKQTNFENIQIEEIQDTSEIYQKNVSKCRKMIPSDNQILVKLDQDIKRFMALVPIISAIRNSQKLPRLKTQIENLLEMKLDYKEMVLEDFLDERILEQQHKIIGMSVQVTQENILKEQLAEIDKTYVKLSFPLEPFKEDNPKDQTYILGDTSNLMNAVDKLILKINQIYGSRYLIELKRPAGEKRKEILMVQEILLEWIKFQRSYIYLESIFSQSEMKKPLVVEVKDFEDNINKTYKANIKKIIGLTYIATLYKQKYIETFLVNFQKANVKLNELNKKINDFLDTKRDAFPRFFFVANDELIYILANYDQQKAVQSFIGKLFENVNSLNFGADCKSQSFTGLIAREGEELKLKSPINIKGEAVEKWMKKLETQMKETLLRQIKEGYTAFNPEDIKTWYKSTSSQVLSVLTQYAWTVNTESQLEQQEEDEESMLVVQLERTKQNLEILVSIIREDFDIDLSKRNAIIALITNEVHNRDIVDSMIAMGVKNKNSFIWQQQLRYYYHEDKSQDLQLALVIRQINSTQIYGYEYYGPCSRIVITPLTDRCWITITSALHMKLGAAPQGPAGTGKTESTKDLAKSLGRFCLVFNCSDQIEFKMMEKLFRGIIQQGAWTCLDEFNRIDIEVLSVISQQLLEMRQALLKHKNDDVFDFVAQKCILKNTCGVFITMNPGYAGRTELPDNLKALFRPVSMMIPDYALIAEILLFSVGFSDSKNLAQKMIKLYKLSSEQLSQQKHYDFGMRAVKSVLEKAGLLKKAEPKTDEALLLIRALKDSNIPKFLKEDLPLFNALIQDLFPSIELSNQMNEEIVAQADELMISNDLQPTTQMKEKINQFYETINVRFGTMIVGKAMLGKTTVMTYLQKSLNSLYKAYKTKLDNEEIQENQQTNPYNLIECTTINPKSVTMGELYGEETANKDWIDGLASHYIRLATSGDQALQKWICFDGPVDALWIENMNSVLDDSRMLCLSNGQRIRLNTSIKILFEVDSLEQASPATVSRCGMVYLSNETLDYRCFLRSWKKVFRKQKETEESQFFSEQCYEIIEQLLENVIPQILEYFQTLNKIVNIVDNQCIKTFTNILNNIFSEQIGFKKTWTEDQKIKYINLAFAFSIAWAFGGCLNEKENEKMENMIKKKFSSVDFQADNIINCYIDCENIEFKLYSQSIENFEFELSTSFWELLVPTVDTLKISYMMELHFNFKRHVFLTGQSGTGKSVLAQNLLKQFNVEKNIDPLNINFSAQTSSFTVQETILGGLFLLSQKSRGAKSGRQNVIFIDDVNMPAKEIYGAQPPIELLRQFFDFGFFYDRKEKNTISIIDTSFLCLAAPAEGGRNDLTQRFLRHFEVICFPNPRNQTISRIFVSILQGYLQPFDEAIKGKCHDIINASIEFYEKICQEKLPTPTKFHYTFNLRDLSKVFMGLTLADVSCITNVNQYLRLWGHEVSRVFHDRLNFSEDRKWFKETMEAIAERFLGIRENSLQLLETNFSDIFTLQDEVPLYEEIVDQEKLIKALNDFQMDFNDKNRNKLNLVFFQQAIDHLLRILRILRQQRGNALLIGLGGLGKSSLTKICSFIVEYKIQELQSQGMFNQEVYREWLRKEVILECGKSEKNPEGKKMALLILDSAINSEQILEDINNLLNSGEVPNIFNREDKEKIQKEIVGNFQLKNITIEIGESWKHFIESVRNNLHIIMCMSPVGESLKMQCRQFPAMVNCCTIDWYYNWEGEALESVAQRIIGEEKIENSQEISQYMRILHQESVLTAEQFQTQMKRKFFITPKTCLDNIKVFVKYLKEKDQELSSRVVDFEKGSIKLAEMTEVVAKLKIDLKKAQPLLKEQSELASQKLILLEEASSKANEKKQKVEKEASVIQQKKEQIEVIQNQAQAQLSDSLPKIQKAENEVRNIDRKELNTLRALQAPPKMIEFIFATVCLALDEKFTTWKDSGKKMLNDLNKFIEKLIGKIDEIKEKGSSVISPQVLAKLKSALEKEHFSEKKLKSNIIAKPLGLWCIAIYDFAVLKQLVEPLEKNAKEMKLKLDEAQSDYDKIAEELRICKEEFDILQDDFNKMESSKQELEFTINQSIIKLGRAEKLTFLLSDEKERWRESVISIKEEKKTLVGEIFISCAYISYLGPLTSQYRVNLLNKYKEIVSGSQHLQISPRYQFLQCLGDQLKLKEWCANGLPSDEVSQGSGLIAMMSNKYPLLIDPQLQANKWIVNILSQQNDFVLIKSEMPGKKIIESLKQALQNGSQVLFENCKETLNGCLDPIIDQLQFFNAQEQQWKIFFNEESLPFDQNFKLYMTTKIQNPNFLPQIFIRTSVINFTVTHKGLEDQLLEEVMKIERPEDEKIKNHNIEKISEFQKTMRELEKKILQLLVQCDSSPVEDENLVTTLQHSKDTAKEINQNIAQIEEIGKEISKTREIYRSVATIGSTLFFVIQDISAIDPMYQYSLQAIIKIFQMAIKTTNQEGDQRIEFMKKKIINNIYTNVSRGIFEAHKKIFSFLIAINLKLKVGQINQQKWEYFLKGSGVVDRSAQMQNPDPSMIDENSWDLLSILESNYPEYSQITQNIRDNLEIWRKFSNSSNMMSEPLQPIFDSLDCFDRLLLVKIFKSQELLKGINFYIEQNLGSYFIENLQVKLDEIYQESDKQTPIIFILSKGADPISDIKKLGEEKGFLMYQKLYLISLGQGQGQRANKLIQQGKQEGSWILLENCHLAKTWMPDLEKQIELIQNQADGIHKDFRLYLTSMPAEYFPVAVLQNSSKITTEPPRGIKANMQRNISNFNQDYLDQVGMKEIFSKMNLGLCLFHAIVQERRKFGSLGWNIQYEFNNSDIEAAKDILMMFLVEVENKNMIPWDSILFLTGSITYGGRVTDDLDLRLLMTILKKFYNINIIKDKFNICNKEAYRFPKAFDYDSFQQFIQQLPLNDSPEIFGLHQQANISHQIHEAHSIMETVTMVMPESSTGSDDSSVQIVKEMIVQFLDPKNNIIAIDFSSGNKDHNKLEPNGLIPSLSTVLNQEISRFNILIKKINSSLMLLDLAIEGKISMSSELDNVFKSLLNNQVPQAWKEVAYPSLKFLSSWFKNLQERIEFIHHWLHNFNISFYWLPGLFFPQGFLTGMLQTHARKYNLPIDQFIFNFKATDFNKTQTDVQPPEDGVYISGLFLEGASWDMKRKNIVDSTSNELFFEMPVIHFYPKTSTDFKGNQYSCPLYKTVNRAGTLSTTGQSTNFILEVQLPCDKTPDFWVMRGVAMFCELKNQ